MNAVDFYMAGLVSLYGDGDLTLAELEEQCDRVLAGEPPMRDGLPILPDPHLVNWTP